MTEPEQAVPESVHAALQSSGFPFQTAVAHVLNPSLGWRVWASEYPWQASTGDSQFLDIIATNDVMYLTIECKKTRKETLIFLRPVGQVSTGLVHAFRCLRAHQITDSTGRLEIFYETWDLLPPSTESEFCVVSTSESGRDQRLLERDAGFVVRATDAFAHDLKGRFQPGRDRASTACLCLPLIVTNAPIYTARYRPTDVSLESGEFSVPPQEIEKAPWVRFSKAFPSDAGPDLENRSVFVVQAASLVEFLKAVRIAVAQAHDKASTHFFRPSRP